MAEEGESGASVHLPLDHLGPGVGPLGAAVVMRQRERRRGGLDVQVEAAGEGVDVGQAGRARGGDPLRQEAASLPGFGASRAAKELISPARAVISVQAAVMPASVSCWPAVRPAGLVSRSRAARRGDRCGRSPSTRLWLM